MTLLVTERSHLGIVMLADTQGEFTHEGECRRESGFGKILYNAEMNVALGGWGKASIGSERLDHWLASFLLEMAPLRPSLRALGEALVARANGTMARLGKSWPALGRRGVHIAGFEGEWAAIYHAHMGPDDGPVGPLHLEDTVADEAARIGLTRDDALRRAAVQLRNGIWPTFIEHWDRDVSLSGWGDMSSLSARADHYPPIFRGVAYDTPLIDNQVSLVAFSARGVVVDRLVRDSVGNATSGTEWIENLAFRAS